MKMKLQLITLAASLVLFTQASWATYKIQCDGPEEASAQNLSVTMYSKDLKTNEPPDFPKADAYIDLNLGGVSSVYALTVRQLFTGHYVAGEDLGPLKSVQTFSQNADKTIWSVTGTLNGKRFTFSHCQALIRKPVQ